MTRGELLAWQGDLGRWLRGLSSVASRMGEGSHRWGKVVRPSVCDLTSSESPAYQPFSGGPQELTRLGVPGERHGSQGDQTADSVNLQDRE